MGESKSTSLRHMSPSGRFAYYASPASDSTKRCATVSGGCTSGAIASKKPFTENVWNSLSFQ